MNAPSHNIEDIQADIGSLYHVLDTLVFMMQGMRHDGSGKGEQYQADGLAWCARSMVEKIDRDIDAMMTDLADAALPRACQQM